MRKIVSIVILILVMTFMLTGCDNSQYKSLGRKNAVQYIEDKYGFKPSVKNVISQKYNGSPLPFSSSSETGYVYVEMKHEDKTFYVFISGTSENTDGIDNYQIRDIENAINEKVQDMVPNIISIDYCIGTQKVSPEDSYYGMVPLKYDGCNLNEVLDAAQLKRIIVSVADSDLSELTDKVIRETFGSDTDILFVNYKSVEDYHKADNTTYGLRDYGISSGIEENDAYIVGYIEF